MIFDNQYYGINYEKAATDNQLLAVTRMLAKDMMVNPYTTVGKFIQSLSDSDIESLMDTIEDNHPNQFEDMIVISEMLANAEGCDDSVDESEARDRVSQLTTYLVIESLYRKGVVKVYHENMSFHPDSDHKIVVEKLDVDN
jgi:hypothetical protein